MANKHRTGCDGKHTAAEPCNGDGPAIGLELAAAREAEAHHRKQRQGASPLDGIGYDNTRGDHDLFRFVESATDDLVSRFISDRRGDPRSDVSASLTMHDFYTLLTFSERCALLALRTGDPKYVHVGLEALTLVDSTRIDWRDAHIAAAMLSWSAQRTDVDKQAFTLAAKHSVLAVAGILERFGSEPVADLPRSTGFAEARTAEGQAFVASEWDPFNPSVDLVGAAMDIVPVLEADRWRVRNVQIATNMPSVWLREEERSRSEATLGSVRAGANVSAKLKFDTATVESQHMIVFLLEAASAADAATIAAAVKPGRRPSSRRGADAGLGISAGALCAVVVSAAFQHATDPPETDETLLRFRPPIAAVLRQYSGAS